MRNAPAPAPAPIPSGVADYFWADAQQRREYEALLLRVFRQWGYADVFPPAFEYATTFDARANPGLREELYRFVDRDGSLLALRADMTIPVARLVGTRLHDAPMPQRFCYAGSIYRYADTRAGQQREFWQAGVELVGEAGPLADAEVLALTVSALAAAGLDDVRLAVGHLGYFDGLMRELALDDEAKSALLACIDRNSEAALSDFLQQTSVAEGARSVIVALPQLRGADAGPILDHAERICLNGAMRAAVANLRAILAAFACLAPPGPRHESSLFLDLTEIHNLGYYTGVTFEALAPGLGYAIASGGRYDHLVGTFGNDLPAVGVAMNLDRILYWTRLGGGELRGPIAPDVLIGGRMHGALAQTVHDLRAANPELRITQDVGDRAGADAFFAFAKQIGVDLALWWDGARFLTSRPVLGGVSAGQGLAPAQVVRAVTAHFQRLTDANPATLERAEA